MAEIWAYRLKRAAFALLYILIYFGMMYLFSAEAAALEEDLENYSGVITILAAVASLGIYYVIFYLRGVDRGRYVSVKKPAIADCVLAFVMAIGFRMLTGAYFIWADKVQILKDSIESAQQSYSFNTMTGFCAVTVILSTVVVAPVFEEVLFRALVQKELQSIMPAYFAALVQGMLFGFAHGILAQSIFAAVYGVVLGIIYYKTDNILIVILAHVFFNLSSVLEVKNSDMMLSMALSGVVMTGASIFMFIYFYSRKKRLSAENDTGGSLL